MKNLAHVINYMVRGGPSNVVKNIVENLDKKYYKIIVITLYKENETGVINDLERHGIQVIQCDFLRGLHRIPRIKKEIFHIIQKYNIDIIHTHGILPDLISSHLKMNIKKISTIHCNLFEDYTYSYGNIMGHLYAGLHMFCLKKMDYCICCSSSLHESLKKKIPETRCICNGIEKQACKKIIDRKELRIAQNSIVYIYVGNMGHRKNVYWLMREFLKAHEENEFLLIVGSGGDEETLCRGIANQNIKILGYQNDPISYLFIADVYVSASKSEGLSISAIEAMDAGLFLFLSDIPSHRELVQAGEDEIIGELFANDDFLMKINNVRDIIKSKKLKKNKIQFVKQKFFSAGRMAAQYDALYRGN